ncbi:MAG TPA: isochorismatase family protein, partial [Vicinamibacterales bacterium]
MHLHRTLVMPVLAGLTLAGAFVSRGFAQAGPQSPSLPRFPLSSTALLVVDPYNDFLSEGGKLWERTKETATTQGLVDHMKQALAAARSHNVKVFIVPHHRYQP